MCIVADGAPGVASRLTNSPTCPRNQTNHQREPTSRNYMKRSPTNRNYSCESGLFLPSLIRRTGMGERGVSDRPEHSQADPSRGGGMGQPGGGGAWGVTWRSGGSLVVLQKSPQRADGNSCRVPAAEQHWLLQKPSRQETAGSVVHSYSVTGRLLWRSLKQPSVPLTGIL